MNIKVIFLFLFFIINLFSFNSAAYANIADNKISYNQIVFKDNSLEVKNSCKGEYLEQEDKLGDNILANYGKVEDNKYDIKNIKFYYQNNCLLIEFNNSDINYLNELNNKLKDIRNDVVIKESKLKEDKLDENSSEYNQIKLQKEIAVISENMASGFDNLGPNLIIESKDESNVYYNESNIENMYIEDNKVYFKMMSIEDSDFKNLDNNSLSLEFNAYTGYNKDLFKKTYKLSDFYLDLVNDKDYDKELANYYKNNEHNILFINNDFINTNLNQKDIPLKESILLFSLLFISLLILAFLKKKQKLNNKSESNDNFDNDSEFNNETNNEINNQNNNSEIRDNKLINKSKLINLLIFITFISLLIMSSFIVLSNLLVWDFSIDYNKDFEIIINDFMSFYSNDYLSSSYIYLLITQLLAISLAYLYSIFNNSKNNLLILSSFISSLFIYFLISTSFYVENVTEISEAIYLLFILTILIIIILLTAKFISTGLKKIIKKDSKLFKKKVFISRDNIIIFILCYLPVVINLLVFSLIHI